MLRWRCRRGSQRRNGAWGLVPSGACAARSPNGNGIDRMQAINPGGCRELRCGKCACFHVAHGKRRAKKAGPFGDTRLEQTCTCLRSPGFVGFVGFELLLAAAGEGEKRGTLVAFLLLFAASGGRCCTNRKSGWCWPKLLLRCGAALLQLSPHSPGRLDSGTATLCRGANRRTSRSANKKTRLPFHSLPRPGQAVTIEIHRIEIYRRPLIVPGRCDLRNTGCI